MLAYGRGCFSISLQPAATSLFCEAVYCGVWEVTVKPSLPHPGGPSRRRATRELVAKCDMETMVSTPIPPPMQQQTPGGSRHAAYGL